MRRIHIMILALFVLLSTAVIPCLAEEVAEMYSEYPMAFSKVPTHIDLAAFLPNGNLFCAYYADNDVFEELCEHWSALFDATGRRLRASDGNRGKNESASDFFQLMIEKNSYQYEQYKDHELDTHFTFVCSLDGSIISPALDEITLADQEKYYAFNAWPYTLKCYPFGEGAEIPLKIINQSTGASSSDVMVYGEHAFCSDGKLKLYFFDRSLDGTLRLRLYDAACREEKRLSFPGVSSYIVNAAVDQNTLYALLEKDGGYEVLKIDLLTQNHEMINIQGINTGTSTIENIYAVPEAIVLLGYSAEEHVILYKLHTDGTMMATSILQDSALWISPALKDGRIAMIVRDASTQQIWLREYSVTSP